MVLLLVLGALEPWTTNNLAGCHDIGIPGSRSPHKVSKHLPYYLRDPHDTPLLASGPFHFVPNDKRCHSNPVAVPKEDGQVRLQRASTSLSLVDTVWIS